MAGRPTQGVWMSAKSIGLGVIVGVLVAELALRYGLGLGDPPLYEPHPTIEYVMKPGIYRRFGNRITVNSMGMRSPESVVHPAKPNVRRVLVIGDSIVNGGSLTDDDDLATSLLERRLSAETPIAFGNVSAGSWGPENWLAFLHERGTFQAEFAVLVINDGDATDVPTFAPLGPDHPISKPPLALWEAMVRYLPRYVPLVGSHRVVSRPSADPAGKPIDALADCVALLRRSGAATCAVLVPAESELLSEILPGRKEIAKRLAELAVPVVFADDRIRAAIAEGIIPYRDGTHLATEGQAILAESLLEALRMVGFEEAPDSHAP